MFHQVLVPFSVLIADDSPTVRRSLRNLIEVSTEGTVCGEADNGAVAIEQAATLLPDVIILDLGMPVLNGLEAARRISRDVPHAALLMFTMYANEHLVKAAHEVGIRRVVSKANGVEDLIDAITSLLAENSSPQKAIGPRAISARLGPEFDQILPINSKISKTTTTSPKPPLG